MIKLNFSPDQDGPLRVLCLGAHSDDIEIGCGGTILRLLEDYPDLQLDWVVFSAIGIRREEASRAAAAFGRDRLQVLDLREFRDGFMPFDGAAVKAVFEEIKQRISPHVIFTHHRRDAHQDHRLISELTWNTFRNHFVLEYEIPKYDGDLGQPSVFVPLSAELQRGKVGRLMDHFQSQQSKMWYDASTFEAIMRLRGMECASPSGYAEAFYCRKMVL